MNLQSKKFNVPSKDKLPPCSTWFRLKAERKIMRKRKQHEKQEHEHDTETPVENTTEVLG